eukprot:CAMPEP_0176164740 /NCGR_PEP_ID=MMETSP0120_2-20121206/84270_1 /TAXON_ID=160619 /ORGANISM="Kryptoperidinium foliaceum, Strain CCMP 1326" /LENGTH=142 /DNA_ID=CAMNT_0017502273 /DNA_START=100 /DNA_END=525 /DNA_ORIENTATION=+
MTSMARSGCGARRSHSLRRQGLVLNSAPHEVEEALQALEAVVAAGDRGPKGDAERQDVHVERKHLQALETRRALQLRVERAAVHSRLLHTERTFQGESLFERLVNAQVPQEPQNLHVRVVQGTRSDVKALKLLTLVAADEVS